MECKYITELGSFCGLGCTEAAGHCWRHINKIEEAEACYTLIVARGMPHPLLGNDVGMPKLLKTKAGA
jgi:hypothetical protein